MGVAGGWSLVVVGAGAGGDGEGGEDPPVAGVSEALVAGVAGEHDGGLPEAPVMGDMPECSVSEGCAAGVGDDGSTFGRSSGVASTPDVSVFPLEER